MIIWLIIVFLFIVILVIVFLLNFYRDPYRQIPEGNNIVSAADGRIISIISTANKEIEVRKGFTGKISTLTKDIAKECYVVSIFMSPLDVHINRAPISGKIKYIKHTKGKFFRAYDLEKSFENEKNEIVIENKKLKIKVIQVAGFLARRIICRAKANQKVNKGQKIGMIALGSQTVMIIPKSAVLKVKNNDKIMAGKTIIAELR